MYKLLKDKYFAPKNLGLQFTADNTCVLISGSIVQWDVVKMKPAEEFGMDIDADYYGKMKEEREEAKARRDKFRKGIKAKAAPGGAA